jgi:hypothetical protein
MGAVPGARATSSSGGAREGFEAWILRGDVAEAERRFRVAVDEDARDPWARTGLALLARRSLDTASELEALLGVVRAAPDEAVALAAIERLTDLAAIGPDQDRAIEAGLAPLAAEGRLRGVAAIRARVARIAAAEGSGDADGAARLRREYGAATEWTLVGPFSPYPALDFDAELPFDRAPLPAEAPVLPGAPAAPARRIPTPDGVLPLGGEPGEEGLHLLAADVKLERGGRYLAMLWTQGSAKVLVDGAPVAERRAFARHEPGTLLREVELGAGLHRVRVRYAPANDHGTFALALARVDGAPSDAVWTAAPVGSPAPEPRADPLPQPAWSARLLAQALERGGGPVLARLLAARATLRIEAEGAKALLAEALALAPDSALVRVALADAVGDDPTLDTQVARARGEAELRRALERDPAEAEARVELASLQRRADRAAEAEALLAQLPPAAVARRAALVERAAVAKARGTPELADRLAAAAVLAAGSCEARELLHDSAVAREAVQEIDQHVRALASCRGGRERLVRHLERRGELQAALEAAAPLARSRPSSLEGAFSRAGLHVAAGDAGAALRELEPLTAWWPRSARLWKRIGNLRELAGDRTGARAARERALAIDGADLALRRALALEDGREVLDDLRESGDASIREYEAAGGERDTSTALVLDAAAQEFHPDGSVTDRTHQIIHVLDQRGVDKYGEAHLPPGSEILTLRTRKRDGRVFEPDGGRAKGTISLTGLEPGDYIEMEFLRSTRGGIDGHAADPFFFQSEGERLVRSTYVAAAPASLGLELDAHQMAPPALERVGDRVLLRATRTDVPGLVGEPSAPSIRELLPFVQVGFGAGREALQRRAAEALASRTRPTLELEAFAREIRGAAGAGAGPEPLARAAWTAVATRTLGGAGSLGSEAAEILSRGRGSRIVLLKAVLDLLGVPARIALVRPFEADPSPYRFQGGGLFDQTLLRIRAGGRDLWIDPDSRDAPFGAVSSTLLDSEALLLPAPGEPLEVVRTPGAALVPSGRETTLKVTLEPNGDAVVEGLDRYVGESAGFMRGGLERFDAAQRRRIFQQSVTSTFRGGTLETLTFRGTEDREGELTIEYRARVPGLARRDGEGLVLERPILPLHMGETYVRLGERKLPLLLRGSDPVAQRIAIVPPTGMALQAAPSREVASRWGRYVRTERLDGGALVRDERIELLRARIAPGEYPEFAAFIREIDGLQATPLRAGPRANPGGPL